MSSPSATPSYARQASHRQAIPISAIVLAQNEEELIGRCLDSLQFVDEVIVVDSGSTDGTPEIASGRGARVIKQQWLGWSAQRSVGISAARNDWVLVVESDEIVSPMLRDAILQVMRGVVDPRDGYSVDRRNEFLGLLLPNEARRHNRKTFVRLFHRANSYYDPEMVVHERVIYPGRAHQLDGPLLHWRGGDLDSQVTALNRYATVESQQLESRGVRPAVWRLLARPVARFVWLYFVRREFRLGAVGFIHAMIRATAEFVRYAKHWERHHSVSSPQPPSDLTELRDVLEPGEATRVSFPPH